MKIVTTPSKDSQNNDSYEFNDTWAYLHFQLEQLEGQRRTLQMRHAELATQIGDLNTRIGHLTEAMEHLASFAGVETESKVQPLPVAEFKQCLVGVGITNAIRSVLRQAQEYRLSASEIGKDLADGGFDLGRLSNPMGTIRKVLARLVRSGEITPHRDGQRVFFQYNNESPKAVR